MRKDHAPKRVHKDAFDISRLKLKPPSPVLTCACSRKYIKTRHGQTTCVPCMFGNKGVANFKFKF